MIVVEDDPTFGDDNPKGKADPKDMVKDENPLENADPKDLFGEENSNNNAESKDLVKEDDSKQTTRKQTGTKIPRKRIVHKADIKKAQSAYIGVKKPRRS